jgi:Domain of unknown function (DUF4189)
MTVHNSKNGAAISMAGATAVAVLAATVCAVAHADEESWGAIAVSPDGERVGVSKDMPDEMTANYAAQYECRTSYCNVMISFRYPECGAVVTTEDQYYRDLGGSQREAEQNAINQSPKLTTKVLRSACNDAPSGRR